jgi:hypothetical protein
MLAQSNIIITPVYSEFLTQKNSRKRPLAWYFRCGNSISHHKYAPVITLLLEPFYINVMYSVYI